MEKFEVFWGSADSQAQMPLGEFTSGQKARESLPASLRELISQCADESEEGEIMDGVFGFIFIPTGELVAKIPCVQVAA
jgi:hypothetical protein